MCSGMLTGGYPMIKEACLPSLPPHGVYRAVYKVITDRIAAVSRSIFPNWLHVDGTDLEWIDSQSMSCG